MTPEESIALIKANLAEVLNPEIIDQAVLVEKRPLRVYWGTAPTGRPHCGYIVPICKIAELLQAGCHVQILLADIHACFDSLKSTPEQVQHRSRYYELVIKSLLRAVGVDISSLHFVLGSSYQKKADYLWDVMSLCNQVRVSTARRAGAEVVKQSEDPFLGPLMYPFMQALDEHYLDVDAQFGGVDQRKIFTCAIENLPRMGYKVRAHLMNPMVPGLGEGGKMSASDPNSKIDLIDDPSTVEKKLKKAVCVPKQTQGNGILAFLEHVIFRALAIKHQGEGGIKFVINRDRDGLEPLVYSDIETLKKDFENDVVTPQILKPAVAKELNELLAPIVADFKADKEWQEIEKLAYPPAEPEKKEKKKKDKGDPAKRQAAFEARKKLQEEQQKAKAEANGSAAVEGVGEGVEKMNVS